jgi:orotidine-5'-phosphate decarboxylase
MSQKTIDYIKTYPAIFTIADAKRGDIGNTSMYAKAFEDLNFDSVTVARTWEKIQWNPCLLKTNIQLCLP